MDNSINRLFSFDSGIYNFEEIIEENPTKLPISKSTSKIDGDDSYLALALSQCPVKSLDIEIEEEILSLIEDVENLKKKSFAALLSDTFRAIEKQLKSNRDTDVQAALSDLIDLLKKNAGLVSLFQSYTNWLQKA
jgi:hypothetical protein